MGVQKGSVYAHIESKADLLWEVAREGSEAFHAALDSVPDEGPVVERIRTALRAHLQVVAEQLDVATVFVREWRYLDGERRALSSVNWAYTWLRPGSDTDELADRFTALLLDGMRGYATR